MTKTKILIISLFLGLAGLFIFSIAQAAPANTLEVTVFWGQGCPHCARLEQALTTLQKSTYPQINITKYEILHNADNQRKYLEFATAYNVSSQGIPGTFIGNHFIDGDDLPELNRVLALCQTETCANPQSIVDAFFIAHPDLLKNLTDTTNNTQYTVIGYIALGAIVLFVIIFLLTRPKKKF